MPGMSSSAKMAISFSRMRWVFIGYISRHKVTGANLATLIDTSEHCLPDLVCARRFSANIHTDVYRDSFRRRD
jgi:hypothetical protein